MSLPIWISYMQQALQGVPVVTLEPPEGVSKSTGDWTYAEFTGAGIRSLGMSGRKPAEGEEPSGESQSLPAADEKKNILDLFKN